MGQPIYNEWFLFWYDIDLLLLQVRKAAEVLRTLFFEPILELPDLLGWDYLDTFIEVFNDVLGLFGASISSYDTFLTLIIGSLLPLMLIYVVTRSLLKLGVL